jgi:glucokinase
MATAGEQALAQAGLTFDDLAAIGVSFGGPVGRDRRHVLRSMHVQAWESMNLPEMLGQRFGLPVYMDNDANAAALGEWKFGAGQDSENLLYVQISTGIGAGLILNGQVYRGAGLAGEFGHITILTDGPLCSCGKRGCLESLTSGWALGRDARRLIEAGDSPQLAELTGDDPTQASAEMLLRAAEQGDMAAKDTTREAFTYLARGLAQAICLLDPEMVILGGGVTRARAVLEGVLAEELDAYLPALLRHRVQIKFACLQGMETLLGAGLLCQGY